jgi:hypothetical protein
MVTRTAGLGVQDVRLAEMSTASGRESSPFGTAGNMHRAGRQSRWQATACVCELSPQTLKPVRLRPAPLDYAARPQGVGMNEEVTKTLLEWATQIKEGVSAEFPKLAQEIVAFELWSSIAWIVVCLVAIRGTHVLIKKANNKSESQEFTDYEGATCLLCLVVGLFCAISLLVNINDAIKAATAPRLVVVEKITRLVK